MPVNLDLVFAPRDYSHQPIKVTQIQIHGEIKLITLSMKGCIVLQDVRYVNCGLLYYNVAEGGTGTELLLSGEFIDFLMVSANSPGKSLFTIRLDVALSNGKKGKLLTDICVL